MLPRLHLAVALCALTALPFNTAVAQTPLSTGFTYQGRLHESGLPFNGNADLEFRLFDAESVGNQIGATAALPGVVVTDGLFTVAVDGAGEFGPAAFNGEARWLEINVNGTPLSPRQPLTAAPYAQFATRPWVTDGADISYTAGKVGIGTNTPAHPLDVIGDTKLGGRMAAGNDGEIGPGGISDKVFDFSHTITDFSSAPNWTPFNSLITIDSPTDLPNTGVFGHSLETFIPIGNVSDYNYVQGPWMTMSAGGDGDIQSLTGATIQTACIGAGTITNQIGALVFSGGGAARGIGDTTIVDNRALYVASGHAGLSGSVTRDYSLYIDSPYHRQPLENHYGIYLADQDFGESDSFAIYSAGGKSYLAGNLGIGTSTPTFALDVIGDTKVSSRVAAGNDGEIGPDEFYDKVFDFSHTITDFSNAPYWAAFRSYITVDAPVDDPGRTVYGHDLATLIPVGNVTDYHYVQGPYCAAFNEGDGDFDFLGGGNIGAETYGPGTVDVQVGAYFFSDVGPTGVSTINTNQGIWVRSGHAGTAGTVNNDYTIYVHTPSHDQPLENHYGLYLEDQDFGANDSYAIYSAGGDVYLDGDVEVTGMLSKGGGSFKIDHPLDPENKYLFHSFVESPDMMNIYNGNVTTDDDGYAVIELPAWFEALNRDFRYQLTAMGQFAQAMVAEEVRSNRFAIRTDKPNVRVSWQVTGIRQDDFANTNRIAVEEDKPAYARGSYLHPAAHGQSQESGEKRAAAERYDHPEGPMSIHQRRDLTKQ